jgi:hypothetical protein
MTLLGAQTRNKHTHKAIPANLKLAIRNSMNYTFRTVLLRTAYFRVYGRELR